LNWRFPSEVFLEKLLKRPVELSIEDALRY